MKQILSVVAAIVISLSIVAQNSAENGVLAGQVVDKKSGETIVGATIVIPATGQGTVTDLDGNYSLRLKPGTYDVKVSYVSYVGQTIEGLSINAGEETRINVALSSNTDLEEIVVRAESINNNEVALVAMQKKSLNVQDGISVSEMKSIGISNAAQAMSRIPGTAVEDGKYMVVRGLGDRYSLTLMDGVILPSVDPNRNSTSLDLIPSGMLDNVIIKKTFTPDMPGNFAGGMADITTKSIPTSRYLEVGVSLGYNTNATFNDNFQRDKIRSNTDWLGYDNGLREIPDVLLENSSVISGASAISMASLGRAPANEKERNLIDKTSKGFNTEYVPVNFKPLPDYGINLAYGNNIDVGNGELGYNIGVKHSRSFSIYDNAVLINYETNTDAEGNFTPNVDRNFTQNRSNDEAMTGAIASISYKLDQNNQLTLKNIYSHIGGNTINHYFGSWPGGISTSGADFFSMASAWKERTFNFSALSGSHLFEKYSELRIDWSAAYNTNRQYEPDLRLYAFVEDNGNYSIRSSETQGDPKRLFRDLVDNQITGKVDFTLPLKLSNEKELKLKWGGYYSNKQRDFSEKFYEVYTAVKGFTNPSYVNINESNGNMDVFLAESNFGFVDNPESNGTGRFYGFGNINTEATIDANQYQGMEQITAGYAMATYPLHENLKIIGGLRMEHTILHTNNEGADSIVRFDPNNPGESIIISSEGNINQLDFLPSLNLIYNLTENTNIRAGFSQTIARPNMREISPFVSYGNIGALIEAGDPSLNRTLIQNYDLRFETFPNPGELFAVSAYYKNFIDPLILNIFSNGSVLEQKPVNVDQAFVYGAEIEIRKSLKFISPKMKNFRVATNASLIYSRINKSQEELERINGDFNGAKSVTKSWRPFPGQSPYIINAALFYNNPALKWESSISFNIFGKRLVYQTQAQLPDVYEVPRPALDFKTSKAFGNLNVSVSVENILDMNYRSEFDFDVPGVNNVYQAYQLGRTFSLGISYSL